MQTMYTKKYGFSLVELSIVLVILGLLVGGILAGQSLIRAAQLRSVSSDINRYITAINSFRDKYFALPGDMTNATSFWGTQDPSPAACADAVSAATATCNGNGNGTIGDVDWGGTIGWATEALRAWQHLANAGLIEGAYSGTDAELDNVITVGGNVPASKIANAGYSFLDNNIGSYYTYTGGTTERRWLNFGAPTNEYSTGIGVIKPEEAWNIDTKMDDGLPAMGRLMVNKNTAGCASTNVANTSVYVLTTTTNVCALGYRF